MLICYLGPKASEPTIRILWCPEKAPYTPQKAAVDVCKLYGPRTIFLPQVAHLTGGSYLSNKECQALFQYLLVRNYHFTLSGNPVDILQPPTDSRSLTEVPTENKVDFRIA